MNAATLLAFTQIIIGALNSLGVSKAVSDIIGRQIAEGRTTWTPEEDRTVTAELNAQRARVDAIPEVAAQALKP